jgi:two-component system, cell cycle sensor histidine kinase and response regulator CckA
VDSETPGTAVTIPPRAPGSPRPATILLVDDEHEVRTLVSDVLRARGYDVVTTSGPVEALRLARETPGSIDLLITDVVMPAMSGLALAERLLSDRPEMKVLYMTGYSNEVVLAHGTPEPGSLIEKPFTPRQISARVREMVG